MTEKLTIKDLNCGNCNVNKNMLSRYGMNCEVCGNVDPKTINKTGCASHPMALQVLAGPVIEELERMQYNSEDLPLNEIIKLLKDGVKE